MILKQCIFTNSDCYKRGVTIAPKGIMVHSTGANNPWLRRYVQPDDGCLGKNTNANDWNRPGLDVCVHAFIGKTADGTVAAYQTLPWDRRGWHAGRGRNGSANDSHISFEICEDGLSDRAYFDKVFRAAAELTAYLCKLYDLDPLRYGVVIDHSEGHSRGIASNHGDVTHWLNKFGKDMDNFRREVKYYMETGVEIKESEENEMRYKKLKDLKADKYNAPYYVPTVEKLMTKGILRGKGGEGDDTIIDLGEDAVRLLVILDKLGKFDEIKQGADADTVIREIANILLKEK